jgi:hypothetical protein
MRYMSLKFFRIISHNPLNLNLLPNLKDLEHTSPNVELPKIKKKIT